MANAQHWRDMLDEPINYPEDFDNPARPVRPINTPLPLTVAIPQDMPKPETFGIYRVSYTFGERSQMWAYDIHSTVTKKCVKSGRAKTLELAKQQASYWVGRFNERGINQPR